MNLELFLFIFTMLFPFNINGIDLRVAISLFWLIEILITGLLKKRNTVKISILEMRLIGIVFIIIIYLLLIIFINQTNQINLVFRYIRVLFSLIVITLFFNIKSFNSKTVLNTVIFVLLLHAISVLLGIIMPSFKDLIVFISNYDKKFIQSRSTGLVSGYDFSGTLCNLGLIINIIKNISYKRKVIDIKSLIFMVAVLFTSRVNMVLMVGTLIVLFIYEIKIRNLREIRRLSKYIIIIFIFVFLLLIMTTEISLVLRNYLFMKLPIFQEIYNDIILSYADYSGRTTITDHYSIGENINIIFGNGMIPSNIDPGYIRTINLMGITGVILQLTFYITILLGMRKIKKNVLQKEERIIVLFIATMVIVLLAMEIKLTFLFSSILFELMMILVIYIENNKRIE